MELADAQRIGNKIINVLINAIAMMESLELTDDELDALEAVLQERQRYLKDHVWIIDPTYARDHADAEKPDIEMGLKRIQLMRDLRKHWQYDADRLHKMREAKAEEEAG